MSYYRHINGVRYARQLLEAAEQFTTGRGESQISFEEIQEIYKLAEDGRRITDVERRTLFYIAENFSFTDKALDWFRNQLSGVDNGELEAILTRVVRGEYGLKRLTCQIDATEVQRQEKQTPTRLFESALRGALDAFLYNNLEQLSLAAFVSRRELIEESPIPKNRLEYYLDQGTLFLIPLNPEDRQTIPYDLPDNLDTDLFWVFGLHIPTFFPAMFIANVLRSQPFQTSSGYLSRQPDLETLSRTIIRQFLDFQTTWELDAAEVERQLATMPGQNFGNALFAAFNGGIFNGESSFSFRDFIRGEVWQDPDLELSDYMTHYINTGKLYLIPLDYKTQSNPSFPVPPDSELSIDYFWYFGLKMPQKTNARFLINVPRNSNDGQSGWNDGFILPDERSLQVQLQAVLENEFSLPNVELIFPEEEFEAQRIQFGPDWTNPQALLRLALNSILNDYVESRSVFSATAKKHNTDVDPINFDDPQEYRAAIRFLIQKYLQTASLELLPIELPDNNPVDGERIEDYWQFYAHLPALAFVGFWVIIPRWPDDEQLPYVYGGEYA
ncbi:MAG: hypothetical protein SFU99_03630 [Saprospiraceae bacterium]|nr:hypothetical protein [Saprospiraceae bacterium]